MKYEHLQVEKKWQEYWKKNETFKTDVWDFSKPKFYALDMFPYPSGVGLHAGHPEGYTATDIISRMKRMLGYNVLHPMGYDSFGLPAEQYAVSTGNHPNGFTHPHQSELLKFNIPVWFPNSLTLFHLSPSLCLQSSIHPTPALFFSGLFDPLLLIHKNHPEVAFLYLDLPVHVGWGRDF